MIIEQTYCYLWGPAWGFGNMVNCLSGEQNIFSNQNIRYFSVTPQSCANAVYQKLTWPALAFSNGITYSAGDFTVSEPGLYMIGYDISFSTFVGAPGPSTVRQAFITLNTSTGFNSSTTFRHGHSGKDQDDTDDRISVLNGSTLLNLVANDNIQIYVYQDSSIPLTSPADAQNARSNEFWCYRV